MSNRNGKKSVFQVPVTGSESDVLPLVSYPLPISNLKVWTRGNRGYITFTAKVYLDCEHDLECSKGKEDKEDKDHMIFNSLYVRHWDEFTIEGKYSHLFRQEIQSVGDTWRAVGKAENLMNLMKYNSPVPPFGDRSHYDISPDGTKIAFGAEKVAFNTSWSTGWEVFMFDLENYSVQNLTPYKHVRAQNPAFSPSGKYLSFLTMARSGYEADQLRLAMYDIPGDKGFILNWNYSISAFHYGHNDSEIIMEAEEDGVRMVAVRNLGKFGIKIKREESSFNDVTPIHSQEGKCVSITSSYSLPPHLAFFDCAYASDLHTTSKYIYEKEYVEKLLIAPWDKGHFFRKGLKVNFYLMLPANFDPQGTFPLVHLIHGGPQGAWNNAWSTRWNPQIWANEGYAVLMVNPRGSTGYPQEFVDAVRGDWGGEPYKDLVEVLEYVKKLPYIDSERVCAAGASYGGYMINWLNGNYHKYKCFVNHDGTFDSAAKYYTTDELFFQEWEFYGTPWSNKTSYDKFTPSRLVADWKTPTLIIHGGKDYRVPLTEGLMTFTALQRKGVPSKLLYYPSENHWVLNPKNSIQWSDESLAWINKWIGNESSK